MITVHITPDLIERSFRTGNIVQQCRVLKGLPKGAEFLSCTYNIHTKTIEVDFSDPLPGPDRIITIHLQSFYHPLPDEVPT